jgi:hypothetical protein
MRTTYYGEDDILVIDVAAIDWVAVDAAALAATPDADSPKLSASQRQQLRPFFEMLPEMSMGKPHEKAG